MARTDSTREREATLLEHEERMRQWSLQTGPCTERLTGDMLGRVRHPEKRYRACLGIIRLSQRNGADRMEAARTRSGLSCGTWEPVVPLPRETRKRRTRKRLSTDAAHRGGVARSVCWAAPRSGGFKSHWRSSKERYIRKWG